MGMPSLVGRIEDGGRIRCVYLHWGSGPDKTGAGLRAKWNSAEQAQEILRRGDLSGIDTDGTLDPIHGDSKDLSYFDSLKHCFDETGQSYFVYLYDTRDTSEKSQRRDRENEPRWRCFIRGFELLWPQPPVDG